MKLLNSLYLIALSSSTTLADQLHAGVQLNQNNFDSLIKDGSWFIEMFSPFCAACKRFAPTWIELADKMKHYESKGLKMGQLDCIAQGDLCKELGVNSYPTMKFYQDGKAMETYKGDNTVEALKKYLEERMEVHRSPPKPAESQPDHHASHGESHHSTPSLETYASDQPIVQAHPPPDSEDPTLKPIPTLPIDTPLELPNPHGHVLSLTKDNWESYMNPSNNPFPIFIQFHTAWCKECRALVPVWEEVARLLKNEVIVADVDCEAKWGKKICKMEHVNEFPSFSIHHDGIQLGYGGPNVASSMAEFIRHSVATPGTHEINMRELDQAIKTSPIFFLFLHSSRTPVSIVVKRGPNGRQKLTRLRGDLKIGPQGHLRPTRAVHLPPVPVVFKEYEEKPWAKLVLEELSPKQESNPTLRFRKLALSIRQWISAHSIPVFDELDMLNYHRVLNSGAKKLVVLALISGIIPIHNGIDLEKSNPRSVQLKDEMKAWAVQWQKSQAARGVEDLTVDWVWVNSDVWADWLRTTYAVNLPRPTEDPRESSMIIIVDAEHHRYYDTQENGRDIEFKSAQVFQTLLAVEMGKLSGKLTGTFSSRMYWRFQRFKHSIGFLFQPHWLLFWTVLFGIIAYSVRKHLASPSHIRVGYTPISPQMSKAFYSHSSAGVSSPDSYGSKSPGFGSVFGLASNVPCKAD
ncbi:hypothetical protein H4Q26_005262 [Puccinia striiformis f. sp. tritici PST-130]|nr:hypothetical protein H4Q26_005262 [Puccinia striiformis f. sp. tritici PST-130]